MFEIGNSLREARVRQGLEFPQVELATKIRAKYLRAIEEEQFEVLPSETYVKGFLRSYAEFLGLDGQLYVDEYTTRYVVDGFDDMPTRRVRAPRGDRALERNVVLLALAGIAALTALVIVAWKFGGGGTPTTAPPVVSQQPAAPTGLEFVGPGTWLQVRARSASGPVLYEGTLRAGEPNFVAGKRFWLWIRHPHRLQVTLAGRSVSLPARRRMHVLVTPSRTTILG